MNIKLVSLLVIFSVITSCKKDDDNTDSTNQTANTVMDDFVYKLAIPNYNDIYSKAELLNSAIQLLNSTPTASNLQNAQAAWRNVRKPWEHCEAFLFGPVDDYSYDPTMDTWPINRVDMDSLLNSSNALSISDIDALPTSLKGFHPIEYMLFGVGGNKVVADFTPREMTYLKSLSESLLNTTNELMTRWDTSVPNNFPLELLNPGADYSRYASNQEVLLTLVSAMAGICDEVANGKMQDPLIAQDSTLQESQFAYNSTADFKNNIIGVQNVYLGRFSEDGVGLDELVRSKNISLDNTIKSQLDAAIASFDVIHSNFGLAIYMQQIQIQNAQNAINNLKNTLETELADFIVVNVKQ